MKAKTSQRMWLTIGILALIFGVITLVFSVQVAHRVVEEVYEEVMGHEPVSVKWHITIGILLTVGGFLAIIIPRIKARKRK